MSKDLVGLTKLIGKVGYFVPKRKSGLVPICGTVASVHIYISKKGIMSVKLHLCGYHGYYRLQDCIAWL